MDKILKFRNTKANYVVYNEKIYYYNLHSGRIGNSFALEKLLLDSNYYIEVLKEGFKYYEKAFWNKKNERKTFYIPLSKEFITFYKSNWEEEYPIEGTIPLYNIDLMNNIESLYEFSLEVEIDNLRTKFTRSVAYENMIYIKTPNDKELEKLMTKFWNNPCPIPELEHERGGNLMLHYIVPTSKIEKIIGVKRFRDITTIGNVDGELLTGDSEDLTLDLHDFDNKICKILQQHVMFTISGY